MNYGGKNIRKEIGLGDLTSKEQEFQNKGREEIVGRKETVLKDMPCQTEKA